MSYKKREFKKEEIKKRRCDIFKDYTKLISIDPLKKRDLILIELCEKYNISLRTLTNDLRIQKVKYLLKK